MAEQPTIAACPTADVLSTYAAGSLAELEASELSRHLSVCPVCQTQFDELIGGDDSLLSPLRPDKSKQAGGGSTAKAIDTSQGAGLDELIRKACEHDTKAAASDQTVTTSPVEDVPLKVFVRCLKKSGLFEEDEVTTLVDQVEPKDSKTFARELVRRKKLTPFQAQALRQGRYKGLVLGNYVVLEKLGEGGMGRVFKARHRRMGRIVCVKVLHAASRKSPELVERFQREVKAVASLNHPNIIVAHDADEADGIPYLVMEFADGSDLARLVDERGPMKADEAIKIVIEVARALDYAHQLGIVHRDIKPSNLLMRNKLRPEVKEDSDPNLRAAHAARVKILDMGLARFDTFLAENPDASTHAAMTNSGIVMGTVDYMSPEQALNSRKANAQSDIYSLGCTLHFLLTGKPLYDGETAMEKLIAHRERPAPRLADRAEGVPANLETVFQRMVAKEQHHRYETMAEVADDLESVAAGGSPSLAFEIETEAEQPVTALARRDSGWMWTTSIAVLALLAGGVLALAGRSWLGGMFDGLGVTLAGTEAKEESAEPTPETTPVADQEPEKPIIGKHAESIANGGAGQAILVIPQGHFHEDEYTQVKAALEKKGVAIKTASLKKEPANPKHQKIKPVAIDYTLEELTADDYDALFFVGGTVDEFYKTKLPNGDKYALQAMVEDAIKQRRAVAGVGSGQAAYTNKNCGLYHQCQEAALGTLRVSRPVEQHPGWFISAPKADQSEALVDTIFDELREPPRKAVLVLPNARFYYHEYKAVTEALAKRGVQVEFASSSQQAAKPKHDEIKPVAIDHLITSVKPDTFDMLIFIGGPSNEFADQKAPHAKALHNLFAESLKASRVVAGIGGGAAAYNQAKSYQTSTHTKQDSLVVSKPASGEGGSFVTAQKDVHADALVAAVLEQLRSQDEGI